MPLDFPRFLQTYASLAVELGRLLGISFVPGSKGSHSPIGKSLVGILEHNNARRLEDRDFEVLRLQFFVKHLLTIESVNASLLRDFRKRLKRASLTDQFYALRFETNIASSLCRRQIDFERGESPDFRIKSQQVSIECTSSRIRGIQEHRSDYYYKIRSAVRHKSNKSYSAPDTCLAIDVTNVVFHQEAIDPEVVRKAVLESSQEGGFGSILAFFVIGDIDTMSIESSYIRADLPWIDEHLRQFLDNNFPFGNQERSKVTIPFEA